MVLRGRRPKSIHALLLLGSHDARLAAVTLDQLDHADNVLGMGCLDSGRRDSEQLVADVFVTKDHVDTEGNELGLLWVPGHGKGLGRGLEDDQAVSDLVVGPGIELDKYGSEAWEGSRTGDDASPRVAEG